MRDDAGLRIDSGVLRGLDCWRAVIEIKIIWGQIRAITLW